ncbi:hypothetical protein QUG02_13880 [Bacillus hominis]|uniref:Uncharacterized protein n=1 Tax=Bacillus hominis TaxID=2817478 RepID=A0ABT7R8D5_9BACI|nr:hypothetical protein [Bacillus hominis]MDM5194058.1 hypothetical protein [Bacillus hominis]MDM5433763.1 hypothetical protein [Bacillus hominis]MDM5439185.1 hypothetical protein [Bacillus hominis]
MRSLSSLIISTICSVTLIIWDAISFYERFTTRNSYYWISGVLSMFFVFFFIQNMLDFINKNYKTS